MRLQHLAAFASFVAVSAGPAVAQSPLPDLSQFLRDVRTHLQSDGQRQYDYSFIERQQRKTLDGNGRVTDVSTAIVESHPGFPGEERWECVLEKDGRKTPEDELKRQVAQRQKETAQHRRELERQTPQDRARQEREWDKQRRELADTIDDVFRVFDIQMKGREQVDGQSAVVLSLEPRAGVKPVSEAGAWFSHFKGRAWVSESEFELIRADVEALDDLTIGFGLLARVHQGTRAIVERRKIGDNRWLPLRSKISMSARVLLFKQTRQELTSEYSNYRRGMGEGSCIISP